jgi:hypothetical protein
MAKLTKEVAVEELTVVEPVIDAEADIAAGAALLGTPMQFDALIGARLAVEGIAAQGDAGWMRGYKWHDVYGN